MSSVYMLSTCLRLFSYALIHLKMFDCCRCLYFLDSSQNIDDFECAQFLH